LPLHTIGTPSKLTTEIVYGTIDTIHTEIQTKLRTYAASDELISINVVPCHNGNGYMGIITREDQ